MRLLTTILILCLPVAAMGETYVCEAEQVSFISKEVNFARAGQEDPLALDLDKGSRTIKEGSGYIGSCEKSGGELICLADYDLDYIQRIILTLDDLIYTNIVQYSLKEHQGVLASYGSCVEL